MESNKKQQFTPNDKVSSTLAISQSALNHNSEPPKILDKLTRSFRKK